MDNKVFVGDPDRRETSPSSKKVKPPTLKPELRRTAASGSRSSSKGNFRSERRFRMLVQNLVENLESAQIVRHIRLKLLKCQLSFWNVHVLRRLP